ncbi:MAG: hypothetical protein ABIN96_09085 [Rubrivivax sp.]
MPLKQRIADDRVLLVDSITQLDADDAGAWVVTGSHGGVSAAGYALAVPMALVVFNDAGVGKDRAGIAALDLLQAAGRAAATVAHISARIGDARDAWESGVLSHVNAAAAALGLALGQRLREAPITAPIRPAPPAPTAPPPAAR